MDDNTQAQEPTWFVRTVTKLDIDHHELVYDGKVHESRTGLHSYRSLLDIAAHLNKHRAIPRLVIECAADAPNPQKYLQKIAP